MAEEPIFVDDSHERTLPVFTDAERPIVERFPELRPMAGMTVGHICGLLVALGEYSRIGYQAAYWIDALPDVWTHPDAIRRHDRLRRFHANLHRSPSSAALEEADDAPDDVRVPLPDPTRLVFAEATRWRVARHKYMRGLEHLTVDELCRLLVHLDRYVAVARPMPDPERTPIEGPARMLNGHNHLLSFHRKPFTVDEFGVIVRALLRNIRRPRQGAATANSRLTMVDVNRAFVLARGQMGVAVSAIDRLERLTQADQPRWRRLVRRIASAFRRTPRLSKGPNVV